MIDPKQLALVFENAIGWTYVTGASSEGEVDCSGLFVYSYNKFGEKIYHGSNTIYRKYCSSTGSLSSVKQLEVGMAVFKWNNNGTEPSQYRNDGIGDMQHIGLVTSINPLRIVHASTNGMIVRVDTKIGNWKYWGKLKAVNYIVAVIGDENMVIDNNGVDMGEPVLAEYKRVIATSGSTVNLRKKMSTSSDLVARMPIGSVVEVNMRDGEWSHITFNGYDGYVLSKFLADVNGDEVKTDETLDVVDNKEVVCADALSIVHQMASLIIQLEKALSE